MATQLDLINARIEAEKKRLEVLHSQKKALEIKAENLKRLKERRSATARKIHAGALVEIAGLIAECKVDFETAKDGLNAPLLLGALLTLTPFLKETVKDPAKRQELEAMGQAILNERAESRRR